MNKPIPLDTIMSELDDNADAWVLQDADSKNYLTIPDSRQLIPAIKSFAADKTPGHADSFVVHSPNEVYEWVREQD